MFRDHCCPTKRAGGLGGGPCKKAESKRNHFSVSLAGSPTKPLTPPVGRQAANCINFKNCNHYKLGELYEYTACSQHQDYTALC